MARMPDRIAASPETTDKVLAYIRGSSTAGSVSLGGRQIADDLGLGLATVQRALHRLLSADQIEVRRRGTGNGYPTTYKLSEME